MDPLTMITTALVVGATAALQETAGQVVKDAYAAFKGFLVERYGGAKTAVELVEEDLSDADSQKVLTTRLGKTEAGSDEEILRRAQELIEVVQRHAPQTGEQLGVDMEKLRVGGNAVMRNIKKGVRGRDWDIKQDLTIENVGNVGDADPNA